MTRLGVNIDHVATLRQQRGEEYPSLVDAARIALQEGADQITVHLREDRRHTQDTDIGALKLVTREFGKALNLEMGCNEDILRVAIESAPDWVCLVPEKREEKTTEGGLNLVDSFNFEKVKYTCDQLKSKVPNIKISLFLESKIDILKKVKELNVDAVEIHTGDYARSFLDGGDLRPFYKSYEECKSFLKEIGLGYHAGHGLTYESTIPLVDKQLFEEYNIGHWIICEAIFSGLGPVVRKLKELIKK